MSGDEQTPVNEPRISVIVPTYGRPESLARLMTSLDAQSMDARHFEVVVVDDGSPEGRLPDATAWGPLRRLIRQRRQGPAAARNRGVAESCGRLLAFVDDDCLADAEWLVALWKAHEQQPRGLLGGNTRNGLPHNRYAAVAESLLHFFDEDALAQHGELALFASNNLACSRVGFDGVGGFDVGYPLAAGEDRAFCRAWSEAGGALCRVADAGVRHCHEHTLASFWRQQSNYGLGAVRFHATASARRDILLPAGPAFYGRLLFHPLRREGWSPLDRLRALPLVALSQLAIAAGLVRARRPGDAELVSRRL